jgi:putative ABC transport system permease protein
VTGEVRDVLPGSPGSLYLASAQWTPGDILYVRGATAAELARLKAQIQSLDPRQAVWEQPLVETVAASTWGARILAAMFMVLALVGSSLAGVGTYAVLAHSATLRRRELGLRAVLGARPRELAWLVMAESLFAGVLGIVVGVSAVAAGVIAVARFQPGLWVYPLAAALMACLLAGASALSARRVLALEPGVALRRR